MDRDGSLRPAETTYSWEARTHIVALQHVSNTLVSIGFDGRDDWEGPARQWVKRQRNWPAWAVNAVTAGDRGLCAQCGVSIAAELRAPRHIDHIVALANGGTNDLSNLQLLCDKCNLDKATRQIPVRSSIPGYLQTAMERRSKKGTSEE